MIKITILYDNRADNCHLQEGWGFSAFIECPGCRILFDTGGDPSSFTLNAQKMNVRIDEITHLLFSHRHWDHVAGFKEVISKVNENTSLYIPKTFPWLLRKIGSSRLKNTKIVKSLNLIAPDVYSLVLKGGFWLHEQALILKTSSGLGVVTGCAHPGIIRILEEAVSHLQEKIAFVVGGFHLLFDAPDHSAHIVEKFQKLGVEKVAPCHCSGDHTIRQFQKAYGSDFYRIGTGSILTF